MSGDYEKFQRHYGSLTTDVQITALTSSVPSVLVPRNVNYQVYIQKAMLFVSTWAASLVKLVGHTTSNVYAEWVVPATAPTADDEGVVVPIDYGPLGLSLIQIGESVDLTLSAAGVVGYLHIEAYQKLGKTIGAYSPDFAVGTAALQ